MSEDTKGLLEEDHAKLGELLKSLSASFDGSDTNETLARLDLLWAHLAVHIRAENLCLFPALLDALSGRSATEDADAPPVAEVHEVIAQLRGDHDFFMHELAGAIKTLRALQSTPVDKDQLSKQWESLRQSIARIAQRLETHNRIEEEEVYRWPGKFLSAAEQTRLAVRVRREIENLPPRLR